ncbi:MAG TPA: thioesterase family protein [Vicinamibacterales bacterium]|nr:thioesterase family protein [Vicinamibacterales bacterium]
MDTIFRHTLDVRFRDCDPMGHVNNAVYLTYLEQARFTHWREVWGIDFERLPPGTPGVILARAEIDYRHPAKYGDVLEIRVGLERIGRTSFTYAYEIVDQQRRVVAEARTVLVIYDYAAGRPAPIPDELRRKLHAPRVNP